MIYRKHIVVTSILLTACLFRTATSFGQTFAEWFQQKKTQIKYLKKQIAELQLYITDLEKGYQVVQNGLQVINNLKHGDFDLHSAYFASLLQAAPSIGQSTTVSDCGRLADAITTTCQALTVRLSSPPALTAPDQTYVTSVLQSLQARTAADMGDLSTLTSDGSLSLHDADRQRRIDALHNDLLGQYRFIQRFSAQVSVYGIQRLQQQADAQTIQQLYLVP